MISLLTLRPGAEVPHLFDDAEIKDENELKNVHRKILLEKDQVRLSAHTKNPLIIGSLFKQFLFALPEPLLTFELYDSFLLSLTFTNSRDRIAFFYELYTSLPSGFKESVKSVLSLFHTISQAQASLPTHRLTNHNLASMFVESFLRPRKRLHYMEHDSSLAVEVVKILIDQYPLLTGDRPPKRPRRVYPLATKHAILTRPKTPFAEELLGGTPPPYAPQISSEKIPTLRSILANSNHKPSPQGENTGPLSSPTPTSPPSNPIAQGAPLVAANTPISPVAIRPVTTKLHESLVPTTSTPLTTPTTTPFIPSAALKALREEGAQAIGSVKEITAQLEREILTSDIKLLQLRTNKVKDIRQRLKEYFVSNSLTMPELNEAANVAAIEAATAGAKDEATKNLILARVLTIQALKRSEQLVGRLGEELQLVQDEEKAKKLAGEIRGVCAQLVNVRFIKVES